jgi:hypothetical protein
MYFFFRMLFVYNFTLKHTAKLHNKKYNIKKKKRKFIAFFI